MVTRHARPCAGHPRLVLLDAPKTWMAGTSPAMTACVDQYRPALVNGPLVKAEGRGMRRTLRI
jgi:hypothetical protein